MKFQIEQIAIMPPDPEAAVELLHALGLTEWAIDVVQARGFVHGTPRENVAKLMFNYQASPEQECFQYDTESGDQKDAWEKAKPLEFEVLQYIAGDNWMRYNVPSVSHLGMHCTAEELTAWKQRFAELSIPIAQDVSTIAHTNPVIAGKRWYNYCIFNTRGILGVDLKFIVRRETP